jgi:hypothetical protein
MSHLPAPFAAGLGELLPILVVIIITIISGIVQALSKMGNAGNVKPPPRPIAPNRPPQPDIAGEIAEFLRRAADRRAQQEPQGQPAPTPTSDRAARSRDANPPATGKRPAAMGRSGDKPVAAQVVREQPVGAEVTDHVQKYMDTGDFNRRSAQLGSEVAQTDQELGKHLHDVFDHQVSALASKPGQAATAPVVEDSTLAENCVEDLGPLNAAALLAQLGTLDGVRQAVVLNEILRRPEW